MADGKNMKRALRRKMAFVVHNGTRDERAAAKGHKLSDLPEECSTERWRRNRDEVLAARTYLSLMQRQLLKMDTVLDSDPCILLPYDSDIDPDSEGKNFTWYKKQLDRGFNPGSSKKPRRVFISRQLPERVEYEPMPKRASSYQIWDEEAAMLERFAYARQGSRFGGVRL